MYIFENLHFLRGSRFEPTLNLNWTCWTGLDKSSSWFVELLEPDRWSSPRFRKNLEEPDLTGPWHHYSSKPSPISPPFLLTCTPQQMNYHAATSQTNLVPIKDFIHKVLWWSRTSGSVLQIALCYLKFAALCAKVPELMEKEKMGQGVQGNLTYQGRSFKVILRLKNELSLDSLILNSSIWMLLSIQILLRLKLLLQWWW